MKKLLVIPMFFIACSKNTEPKVEIWGDDSTGFSVRTFAASGSEYYKWSDCSCDTTSMRLEAKLWYKNNL